jgi:DNA-directed RNA polymerase specialized sigma subunit
MNEFYNADGSINWKAVAEFRVRGIAIYADHLGALFTRVKNGSTLSKAMFNVRRDVKHNRESRFTRTEGIRVSCYDHETLDSVHGEVSDIVELLTEGQTLVDILREIPETETERTILEQFVAGEKGYTTAENLGLSSARVSQILNGMMQRARKMLSAE